MIKLFDYQNGVIVPSIDIYNMKDLNAIVEQHPKDHMSILSFLFYMTCKDEDLNPYFNVKIDEMEEIIMKQTGFSCSLEDPLILAGFDLCTELYQTPTSRLFEGAKSMMDKFGDYMLNSEIEHGRDGNITAIQNMFAKFEGIRISFKGILRDLKEEQKSTVRGGQHLAIDQIDM